LVVRKRRTSEKTRENHNNEPMKLMIAGMENEAARGSVAPSGRTGFFAGFPEASSLANLRGRCATTNRDVEVGKGGNQDARRWEKAVQNGVFFRDQVCFSRFFAAFPGFSRLFPHQFFWPSGSSGAWKQDWGPSFALKLWRPELRKNVTGCYALLRESPRSFTKVRTDQARKSSMLRIVTGGTLF
jgi:hypothetical protein